MSEQYKPTPEEFQIAKDHLATNSEEKLASERREKIEQVIERHRFWDTDNAYSDFYSNDVPDGSKDIGGRASEGYIKFISENRPRLEGGILVDVGSGWGISNVCEVAAEEGVSKYIGVDKFAPKSNVGIRSAVPGEEGGPVYKYGGEFGGGKDTLTEVAKAWKEERGLEIELKTEDGLRYLSTLPDNYSNITVNGLDGCIIRGESGRVGSGDEYFELLAEELARVAGTDHIIFGIAAWPVFNQLRKLGLREIVYREESKYPITVFRQDSGEE